jgi:hypothetical protein
MIRRVLLLAVSAALAACTSETTTTTSAPEITENPVVENGQCNVKGWDCSTIGKACSEKCYAADGRKDAYVALLVNGNALDSRSAAFDPVDTADRTLKYGCGLFTATDGTQGLIVLYRENTSTSSFEDDTTIRLDDFAGPGAYQATVRYSPSDMAQLAGKIYAKKNGCAVDVKADGRGGVTGTINCPTVPSADGSSVAISGEFACGGTAFEPITVRLP